MLQKLRKRLLPDGVERDISSYIPLVNKIREKESGLTKMSERKLKAFTHDLRERAQNSEIVDDLLVDAFAVVSETAFRKVKMRPYDVQLIAAMALHQGRVIEMATGEGKTLAATLSVYLNALAGKGVHVHTFNDYLARRDAEWMRPVYEFLGLSVGFIQEEMPSETRREAYRKNVVYLTAREGGFDYLRNFLVKDRDDLVISNMDYAIVDEADSLLIDEARIPLVIAGADDDIEKFDLKELADLVKGLENGIDFQTDEFQLNIFLTDAGIGKIEQRLGCQNLHDEKNESLLTRINQALQAEWLLKRDVDYIVREGKIEIVDEFTGRVVEKRKWPHGLQAAIEAKEGVDILPEGKIYGKTTLQHYFQKYEKLAGMTGTATPAAFEFEQFYGLNVTVVPSHKPNIRLDHPDRIFLSTKTKFHALTEEIKRLNEIGRPVLVGTSNVEESEALAHRLRDSGVACQVLNAKNDEQEAGIIAKAGMSGAVTISTNMAGRGTDIKPGGGDHSDEVKVLEMGGLYVMGTNRFESRRIDNQLRGRAGRQGDPGETCFFISLEDLLLKKHGVDDLIPAKFRNEDEMSLATYNVIKREVDRVQRRVEGKNFEIRETLWKYADFLELQRLVIHNWRQAVLSGDFDSLVQEKAPELYARLLAQYSPGLVRKAEQQVSLAIIDRCWADYLEEADRIRQGIHMKAYGGQYPLLSYQKSMSVIFDDLLDAIEEAVIEKMKTASITPHGIDLEKEGLKGPTATWTYLVNDNPFGDRIEMMLVGNVGFAAAAAIYMPLLFLYFFFKRLFTKEPPAKKAD